MSAIFSRLTEFSGNSEDGRCAERCLNKYCIFPKYTFLVVLSLWSSGQSFWLQIQRSRVRYPALPDFLSSSESGTGSTQPREVN